MALYRFSCSGDVIDEREFYSGEDVYAHAQYLANQTGDEVHFVVLPKYDSVKPQQPKELSKDTYEETNSTPNDDWETKPSVEDDWETETKSARQDVQMEVNPIEDEADVSFVTTIIFGVVAGIVGLIAVAVFFLTHQASLNKTHAGASQHKKLTPLSLGKTKDNQLAGLKGKLVTSSTKEATSREPVKLKPKKSPQEISDISIEPKSLNKLTESSTSRGKKYLTKSPSSSQLKRQKKQGGSKPGRQRNETISPRPIKQTSATASPTPTTEKLPSGGF